MRLRALLREAYRDTVGGTARFATFGLTLLLVLAGLAVADAAAVEQQVVAAQEFRASGAATRIIAAEGRIDPAACEVLTTVPGVSAAGAIRASGEPIVVRSLPGAPVPAYEVSPGFARVVAPDADVAAGALLSKDLADDLDAPAGTTVLTDRGEMRIGAAFDYPTDGRRAGLGYAVLAATPERTAFDECWVSAWPEIANIRALLLGTLRADGGGQEEPPQLVQLNASLGEEFGGGTTFLDRPTRAAVPVAALVALGLGYLSVRLRRLQLASALHAGVTRADAVAIQLLEAAAWAGTACVIGAGFAAVAAVALTGGESLAVFRALAGIPLAGFAGALSGAAIAAVEAREKQLLRFFKER